MVPLVVTKVGRYAVELADNVPKNIPLPQTVKGAKAVLVAMVKLPLETLIPFWKVAAPPMLEVPETISWVVEALPAELTMKL